MAGDALQHGRPIHCVQAVAQRPHVHAGAQARVVVASLRQNAAELAQLHGHLRSVEQRGGGKGSERTVGARLAHVARMGPVSELTSSLSSPDGATEADGADTGTCGGWVTG